MIAVESIRIERTHKRIRPFVNGVAVADTTHALMVWERAYYPAYYFPRHDVRTDLLVPTSTVTHSDQRGDATHFTVKVDGTERVDAAWQYPASPVDELRDTIRFDWNAMEAWFEEDEEVIVHPRDPHTRVDILASSRHVRVEVGGVALADSTNARVLYETGLPPRWYFPVHDVRMELLVPTDSATRCPYKGQAEYWSVNVNGGLEADLAWSYPHPLPESDRVRGLIAFYNERVDLVIDDTLEERPRTKFSESARQRDGRRGGKRMRLGLDIAQQRVPFEEVIARAKLAEELGFDGVWGFDHFQPMYGDGPGECFESQTTLAALSGHTSRVRMGTLITGVTYRHPAVYASECITIDHASHGRLELAYGAAWFDKEHNELGIPFPGLKDRIDAFEEAVQIVRGLLTTDDLTFEGAHFSTTHATLRPRPVQQPHPPIWIGAHGEKRMMPIAARYADVWHSHGPIPHMEEKSGRLSKLAEAAGRDPAAITRAGSLSLDDVDEARGLIDGWEKAGFGYLVCGWPGAGRRQIEAFADAVLT